MMHFHMRPNGWMLPVNITTSLALPEPFPLDCSLRFVRNSMFHCWKWQILPFLNREWIENHPSMNGTLLPSRESSRKEVQKKSRIQCQKFFFADKTVFKNFRSKFLISHRSERWTSLYFEWESRFSLHNLCFMECHSWCWQVGSLDLAVNHRQVVLG